MAIEITGKSLGKHIGHACEGHARGLLMKLASKYGLELRRTFPFDFHVNPDAVLVEKNGSVRMVVIVAFWNHAGSSEKKLYRTRSEYVGAKKAQTLFPERFTKDAQVLTLLYGANGGWKEQILVDLKSQCTPCFYFPEMLGFDESESLVNDAFSVYRAHLESGGSKAREYVEGFFARKSVLTDVETKLLSCLEHEIQGTSDSGKAIKNSSASTINIRIPIKNIKTRYRQGLGILSLFKNSEITTWQGRKNKKLIKGAISDFAARCSFLDLARLKKKASLVGSFIEIQPKIPLRQRGNQMDYAPDMLDFENWEEIPNAALISIIDEHREKTRLPGTVFAGGAYDQVAGNWIDIANVLLVELPLLLKALRTKNINIASKVLSDCNSVGPEIWHPAYSGSNIFPLWSFSVCALAITEQSRLVRSEYNARIHNQPELTLAMKLASNLISSNNVIELFEELQLFLSLLISRDFEKLASLDQPKLLSLSEPCSWVSDIYNTLTTNSSHNPLNAPLLLWLKNRFPKHEWQGWPARRSVSISSALGSKVGRRQWQFIGTSDQLPNVVAVEVKSITGNNWGNKSKELYDRVAETRAACKSLGLTLNCIGVLDGDFGEEQFQELRTGIGYDEVFSITDIVGV